MRGEEELGVGGSGWHSQGRCRMSKGTEVKQNKLFSLVVSGAVEGDEFGKEAGVDPVDSGTVLRNFT